MTRPIDRLLQVMARLREPERGCPWDLEQTFATIAPYTIEEAYEVADAIEHDDLAALRDELGDLLLQVVFHAQMAHELDMFDFDEVATAIADKMVRRHPHVFGEDATDSVSGVRVLWEEQKAAERAAKAVEGARPSTLDGVAKGLPALLRAAKLQKRAARVGFDWAKTTDILDKIEEEIGELRAELAVGDQVGRARVEDELGDLLFAIVNLARRLDLDPEAALRSTNGKFERRFRSIESRLAESGRTPEQSSLEEMDALWDEAKAAEKAASRSPEGA